MGKTNEIDSDDKIEVCLRGEYIFKIVEGALQDQGAKMRDETGSICRAAERL
jgi:hypothetical protein